MFPDAGRLECVFLHSRVSLWIGRTANRDRRGVSMWWARGQRAYFIDRDDSVGGLCRLGCCVRRHCEFPFSNGGSIDSVEWRKPSESMS